MAYARLAKILHRAIGLDAASIGRHALASAVRGRMAARGLSGADAYIGEVEADPEELQALIEAVVVPETWFLRDREAFNAVAELAQERAGAAPPVSKLRLISIPCSTGEEPYSLAMTLLDAGLSPAAFEIHAFDVSRAAISRALAGVYRRNAFRGGDLEFRGRHFAAVEAGWRISPQVAGCVRFVEANLLELGDAAIPASYDVVFCRNLLIYFDAETQQRAIRTLGGLLKPGGLVFVGPGEANLMLAAGFSSVQRPLSFCFRSSLGEPAQIPAPRHNNAASASRGAPRRDPPKRAFVRTATTASQSRPEGTPALADAQRLADLGRTDDAIRACESHLRLAPPSAAAWRLLGVLSEAREDLSRAGDCYRRALYLDPADAETLSHLALLLQRQGDLAGAGRVRERARRLSGAKDR